jgi:hypothetical protein
MDKIITCADHTDQIITCTAKIIICTAKTDLHVPDRYMYN